MDAVRGAGSDYVMQHVYLKRAIALADRRHSNIDFTVVPCRGNL